MVTYDDLSMIESGGCLAAFGYKTNLDFSTSNRGKHSGFCTSEGIRPGTTLQGTHLRHQAVKG